MSRTFKQWAPATAELDLLYECWLARLPPARIAARLGISEPKLARFLHRVHAAREMPRPPEPARPRPPRLQTPSSDTDRLLARVFGVYGPWLASGMSAGARKAATRPRGRKQHRKPE